MNKTENLTKYQTINEITSGKNMTISEASSLLKEMC